MRLKTLTATAVTCVAALGVAAPAQATPDAGNGTTQRCTAAENGNHNGFTCANAVDDSAGACPRGYTLVVVSNVEYVDANLNGLACARG